MKGRSFLQSLRQRNRGRRTAASCASRKNTQENPMPGEVEAMDRARDQARQQVRDLSGFDYASPAELFPSRSKKGRGQVTYRRFDTAAEAIRFAVEEIPPPALLGVCLEVDEARFGLSEIHHLYESAAYPLKRREEKPASNEATELIRRTC
jgi:hypothetical protein